jgi:uncharacterized membrane protein required for colicin V production
MYYDIAVIAVLIIFIIIGIKKGFISLYNRLLPLVGAVIIAAMFFSAVSAAAMNTPLGDVMTDFAESLDPVTLAGVAFPIVGRMLMDILAVVVLFSVSLILMLLLRKALQKAVARVKALNRADKIIGAIAWLLVGFFVVYLLLGLIQMFAFAPYIDQAAETLSGDGTLFAGRLYSDNLLLMFLGRFFNVDNLFATVAEFFS